VFSILKNIYRDLTDWLTVLTNYTEHIPSAQINSCSAAHEIVRISYNWMSHYRALKSPRQVSILGQTNSVHILPPYPLTAILVPYHLCRCLPNGVSSGLFDPNAVWISNVSHACYMSDHLTLLVWIILLISSRSCCFHPVRSKYLSP